MVQDLIDETFAKFKDVVATGRRSANKANYPEGRALVDDWQSYADGRVFSGKQAHELGFVDELGTMETAVQRARTLTGISDANLIEYHQPFNFENFLNLFGKSDARAIKVDLGFDAPKIKAGNLYYITPLVL
jgi:protease-4